MEYRALGRTGLTVSEVGMGCNRLGETIHDDDHWVSLVKKALDFGVTVFDTAEAYGGWYRSEEMLGLAIGNDTSVAVATKVCRVKETGEKEYTAARVIERCEASLRRLRREVIDIYQVHGASLADLDRYDWAEGMGRLKEQGKIKLAAVAVNSTEDGVALVEKDLVDVLQITYNMFATDPEERLFALAEQHGVGLLVRMPLARGVLTGKFQAGQPVGEGHRILLTKDHAPMIEKAEALRPLGAEYSGGMTRMAHHFSLAPEAVSAIIPGARNVEQLTENVAASGGGGLSAQWRKRIDTVRAGWG